MASLKAIDDLNKLIETLVLDRLARGDLTDSVGETARDKRERKKAEQLRGGLGRVNRAYTYNNSQEIWARAKPILELSLDLLNPNVVGKLLGTLKVLTGSAVVGAAKAANSIKGKIGRAQAVLRVIQAQVKDGYDSASDETGREKRKVATRQIEAVRDDVKAAKVAYEKELKRRKHQKTK